MPVSKSGFESFNIDDHRKSLNRGSSHRIPKEIRERATADYLAFIERHIRERRSFAIEVTLAGSITFEQAARARTAGFHVRLTYFGAEIEECIQRVANRVELGGHGVTPRIIRRTYAESMANLPRAVREFDIVHVHDNGRRIPMEGDPMGIKPPLVLESQAGRLTFVASDPPPWCRPSLAGLPIPPQDRS